MWVTFLNLNKCVRLMTCLNSVGTQLNVQKWKAPHSLINWAVFTIIITEAHA